jgi:hypothetical protein
MSHFYRLYTINDFTGKKCGLGIADLIGSSGQWNGLPIEYWRDLQEIEMDPPWSHCKALRAPLVPDNARQIRFVFNRQQGVALPDLWSWAQLLLVSERAKKVLMSCDDFDHEFIEVEVCDIEGRHINETPYYAMNVRRILAIDKLGGNIENEYKMFCPIGKEYKYLPVVQRDAVLKENIARLPIWRHDLGDDISYISEATLNALENAGLTGLARYSTYDGLPGEAIGRFE